MTSAEFHGARIIGAPLGWDETKAAGKECSPLYISDERFGDYPAKMSIWTPTDEERAKIANGGYVVLMVVSNAMPPVAVWAIEPTEVRVLDDNAMEHYRPL